MIYLSNNTGDLYDPNGKKIEEVDLPDELKKPHEEYLYDLGMYNYLIQYEGKNGYAIVNEYHEYNPEGNRKTRYNYDYAVRLGQKIEKRFPKHTVFIGKQMGFPGAEMKDGTHDEATELVVFIPAASFTEGFMPEFEELVDYLDKHAYA